MKTIRPVFGRLSRLQLAQLAANCEMREQARVANARALANILMALGLSGPQQAALAGWLELERASTVIFEAEQHRIIFAPARPANGNDAE